MDGRHSVSVTFYFDGLHHDSHGNASFEVQGAYDDVCVLLAVIEECGRHVSLKPVLAPAGHGCYKTEVNLGHCEDGAAMGLLEAICVAAKEQCWDLNLRGGGVSAPHMVANVLGG